MILTKSLKITLSCLVSSSVLLLSACGGSSSGDKEPAAADQNTAFGTNENFNDDDQGPGKDDPGQNEDPGQNNEHPGQNDENPGQNGNSLQNAINVAVAEVKTRGVGFDRCQSFDPSGVNTNYNNGILRFDLGDQRVRSQNGTRRAFCETVIEIKVAENFRPVLVPVSNTQARYNVDLRGNNEADISFSYNLGRNTPGADVLPAIKTTVDGPLSGDFVIRNVLNRVDTNNVQVQGFNFNTRAIEGACAGSSEFSKEFEVAIKASVNLFDNNQRSSVTLREAPAFRLVAVPCN